ncbi:MAG: putative bifunctional diguanylate cyclase/phosphodiesterase [Aminipila sp.]
MLKQKHIVFTLLVFFFIYFTSVLLQNDFWGNVLSPIVALLSSIAIITSISKIKDYKICWMILFFYPLIWCIADSLWLVYENIFLIDPVNINYINALYTFSNIFLAVAITYYFALNLRRWNLYQLVLDMLAISSILAVLLWSFIFSRTSLDFHVNFEYINTMICIFFDFYIFSGISVAFISTGIRNIGQRYFLVIAGIGVVTFIDYYYAYLYLMNLYQANTLVDGIYMIGNVLFALGAVYESTRVETRVEEYKEPLPENIRKPYKIIFVFMLLIILYITDFLTLKLLLNCFILGIAYWIITAQIQEGIQSKYLLKSEVKLNKHLEKVVAERTKELIIANKDLEEISNRDPLTGLYNRRQLIKYLDSLIASKSKKTFTLLYIDANRFKAINDSYGHQIGDHVLCALGNRLTKNCLPDCTVFRIGGDEFAVVIDNNTEKKYVCTVAEKLLELIQMPISVSPYVFTVTASIGIVSYPEDAEDKNLLMRYADIAMYEAKKKYIGNNYLFFDSAMSEKIVRKNEIEILLKRADYDREFVLYYQPQYSTEGHCLIGMEALLRWIHPEKGFISPGEFIPIAEECGAIIKIGEWVIDKALSQIKKWNESYSLGLKISINVSPLQIEKTNFLNWFKERFYAENVDPSWVDLEITEGSAMIPNETNEQVFSSFAKMGINTSIDDFGTGYASLNYIKKFDFDRLKIAKELIDNIADDKNAILIVQSIIMMARGMGIKTIAEGVEDINQLHILEQLGCDEIQGYIFGRPVPAEQFEKEHINKKLS